MRASSERLGADDEIESAIANYETAYRMQTAVPELMDIKGETAATRKLYGLDAAYAPTRIFGRAMPDRPPLDRTRRALHRTDLSRTSATTAGTSTAT